MHWHIQASQRKNLRQLPGPVETAVLKDKNAIRCHNQDPRSTSGFCAYSNHQLIAHLPTSEFARHYHRLPLLDQKTEPPYAYLIDI